MTETEIAASVIAFVGRSYPGDDPGIAADTRLLEEGVVDSLGLLDLVAFIEERFGIFVEDAEVDLDNFGTAGTVASFVARKMGRG